MTDDDGVSDAADAADADSSLAPVRVNHVALFATGTGLWAIALVVLVIIDATGRGHVGNWMWVCLAGIGLGAIATIYARLSWRAR